MSEEKALEFSAKTGALDCIKNQNLFEIITKKEDFYKVKSEFEKISKNLIYSGIEWRSKNLVRLEKENLIKLENMLEILQDDDDIQNVFHNCKIL